MALEIQDWYELRSISVRKFCEHKERLGARSNKNVELRCSFLGLLDGIQPAIAWKLRISLLN